MRAILIVLLLLLLAWSAHGSAPSPHPAAVPRPNRRTPDPTVPLPPNLVLVLTDDQDTWASDVAQTMPRTKALLQDQGMRFTRAFANTPCCCPSRATLLAGRLPHTPGMTRSNRVNCGGAAFRNGPEKDGVAVHLQRSGYRTLYAGKYLNTYGTGDPPPSHVPPGWSEWFALVGNSKYWNYSVSDEGVVTSYGAVTGSGDYFTDAVARRAARFIRTASEPFFAWVSPPSAHAPFTPARRHAGTSAGQCVKRTLAFNAPGLGKHEPYRSAEPLSDEQMAEVDEIFRARAESLRAVDELVVGLVASVRDREVHERTFFVFTSDHGFHLGQFRLAFDKRQPYDTDILVPLLFAGPGIRAGAVSNAFVSHVDLGPTLLDLAGVATPPRWDGTSFKHALFTAEGSTPELRHLVLVEYQGEGAPALACGSGRAAYDDLDRARELTGFAPTPCDHWNNTYACLRGSPESFVGHEFLFCEFRCFVHGSKGERELAPCTPGSAEATGEFYNIDADPFQMHNAVASLTPSALVELKTNLAVMRLCSGSKQCRGGAAVIA